MKRRDIIASVFIAGFVSLGLEMAASRLLGNVFGTSNLVWANIIGLILIYLSLGYFLGGRWADRSPHAATFYRILAWAAFTAGMVPMAAAPVLRAAASAVETLDTAVMLGSFLSVLVLFSVPVTLLGCISPFAIRLAISDAAQAGSVSGRIYAVSTFGSILGTFLPVLWLIPTLGTARTFLALSLVLMAAALTGLAITDKRLALRYAWMPIVLIALAWAALGGPIKETVGQIYEGESSYNYIQVVERNGTRYLMLNEGQGIHSMYTPGAPAPTYGTWDYFLSAPFWNAAPHAPELIKRLGLVGLAAGTIAQQYTEVFGAIPIDGWEIDPDIVEVGRQFFEMTESNLHVFVADGRWGLVHSRQRYSVVGVDAYRLPYIPAHLTTREFFGEVRDRLTEDGVLVINVGRTPDDRRLVEAMASTIGSVFASVHVVDVPATFNTIIYGTVQPTSPVNLLANLAALEQASAHPLLIDTLTRTAANLQPTPMTGAVFSDDWSPIEQLTNDMAIRFILGGSLDTLR